MKKSSKYNLLSKNEPKRQKDQQEWVEMQSVRKWQGKAANNDTSYMKFEQEQQSEIGHDNVNVRSNKSSYPVVINNNKNFKPSTSTVNEKRMAYLQGESLSQQQGMSKIQQQQQQKQPQKSSIANQPLSQSQINNPSIQKSQYQNNNMNPPPNTIKNPQYYRQSTFSQYNGNPNNSYYANYPPSQQPIQYNNYPHQSMYMTNNNGYRQQSQMPMYNQSYYPPQRQQQNIPNPSTLQSSINANPTRSSTRHHIPQMTVNCQKCTFTQSVPGNSQMYICCMCNQINECFPLYGVFTCGICRANVIYPYGTSTLIKCTKCLTVNRVNPEPLRRNDDVVAVGKEEIQLQEKKVEEKVVENRTVKSDSHQKQKPFKILPAQKSKQIKKQQHKQQVDFFSQPKNTNKNILINQPQIIQQQDSKHLHRQYTHPTIIQFKQELLINLNDKSNPSKSTQKHQHKNVNDNKQLHEQLLQLTQKLDESLVIVNKQQIKKQNKQFEKSKNHQFNSQHEYPSIFDD